MDQSRPWFEILAALASQQMLPRRILLYGPPGTGKSSWAHYFLSGAADGIQRLALTEDSDTADVLGQWTLRQGETLFLEAAPIRAMRAGVPLVLDEIDRAGPPVMSFLHALLDDEEISALMLPTGEVVRPKKGYIVIGTMNGNPMALDEPILDRFDAVLAAREPHPDILAAMDPDIQRMLLNFYRRVRIDPYHPPISVRRAMAFINLRRALPPDEAALVAWGDNAKDVMADLAGSTTEGKQ